MLKSNFCKLHILMNYYATKQISPASQSIYSNHYTAMVIQSIAYLTRNKTKSHRTLHLLTLNWLIVSTKPDIISTATSIFVKSCQNPSKGHIEATLRVVKHLKCSQFSSKDRPHLQSFLQIPFPESKLSGLCGDTNR